MGVILDIAPKVTVIGGGGGTADVDLSDVYQKINENKLAIGDLSGLSTEEKASLVNAVNEVKSNLTNKAELVDEAVMAQMTYLGVDEPIDKKVGHIWLELISDLEG